MRIAVCAPQVPFARGGAEIFADDLVGELRDVPVRRRRGACHAANQRDGHYADPCGPA